MKTYLGRLIVASSICLVFNTFVFAQSGATRPRRARTVTSDAPAATSTPSSTATAAPPAPVADPAGTGAATVSSSGTTDTTPAYTLLQQKQYAAAARMAKQIAAADPKNSEAWKIAGFAELNLKQYAEAATDLQRAYDLQRAAKQEDPNTIDALAEAYVRTEKFDQALPLLVAATTRPGKQPDALLLYYRGIAEYRTNRRDDAERSLNAAIKADPKNAAALFYLGRIAYERKQFDQAILTLNRATLADPRFAESWTLLTTAYLNRAALAGADPKADADYLSAVRAAESLYHLRPDAASATLYGQALIGAKQYARAAAALDRFATIADAPAATLYLLGVSHVRAKNYPKAITALERAATKDPQNPNIYRELGYAYEVSKLYAKALGAYQKGAEIVPDDADFKESVERVRPFAK